MVGRGAAQEARARRTRPTGIPERTNHTLVARETEIVVRRKIVRRARCGRADHAAAILAFEFLETAGESCEVQLRDLVERARELRAEVEEFSRRR
jgi:hypothetical protein